MDERNKPSIEEFLMRGDVQEIIRKSSQRVRSEATVTIGRAANLFGFTENQLRDWEERKLLTPLRPPSGQRQYSYMELDKLAIIKELLNARYAPGEIPSDIYDIWEEIVQQNHTFSKNGDISGHVSIDERIARIEGQAFWRFFVSRTLRLCLMLACEDALEGTLGIMLPLQIANVPSEAPTSANIAKLGRCLIGWLSQNGSFTTFIDSAPSFQYESDFRVHQLKTENETTPADNTQIVMQRRAAHFHPSVDTVETIRRLLTFLYENKRELLQAFGQGMRDLVDPLASLYSSGNTSPDIILSRIADAIVDLGRQGEQADSRWRFCSILLPQERLLPLHQRSLLVYAQSKFGPYKTGVKTFSPSDPSISYPLRAFQSGHLLYRPSIADEDAITQAIREEGRKPGSVLAIPVGGEDGIPQAVIYVVAEEENGFTASDMRVLRVVGRIIEELLRNYEARYLVAKKLVDLIEAPEIIDMSFRNFYSENRFLQDVKAMLSSIEEQLSKKEKKARTEGLSLKEFYENYPDEKPQKPISLIAIDIDNHSALATKYGDRVMRNISREVGLKIQGQFRAIVRKDDASIVYHIYADRFYILMQGIESEQAYTDAIRLGKALRGPYLIDSRNDSIEQPTLPNGKLHISEITVRLAVTSYQTAKLEEILRRYPADTNIAEVGAKLSSTLDDVLHLGMDKGGNVVIGWDHTINDFKVTSLKEGAQPSAGTQNPVSGLLTN